MAKIEPYVFRFDNWAHDDMELLNRIYKWCGMYEISIKYIGKNKSGRCKYLQIELCNPLLVNFIINNAKYWELYKKGNF